ncbi:endonuclease/exonuclease/phosphatase family protein [Kitasatospora aureofaciens]|uniref:endonuclease/exonuclease/phosphatase family protein n=1 Tax=Kitasatospora aureofaciens TaxID=1894 RepID=UPI001C4865BA|nr:endonuclease/exonuclease/phosphatase family protein [Kitasatospora aureofaciens]MBV6696101.1 endonuclease/exonuclease/phosphatase family protein [Kitasatospora aureofaciens]
MTQTDRTDRPRREESAPDPAGRPGRFLGLRHWGRDGRGSTTWRRGLVLAALALLTAVLLAFHAEIPNSVGNLGSLLETFLPWAGLAVPVLLVAALLRRSATALIALLVPAVLWLNLFGGLLTDKSGGKGDWTVVSHNVAADNTDVPGTVRGLVDSGAQIVALQELAGKALRGYETGLAPAYPYHAVEGTVGLWSKYPIADVTPVDLKMGWTRAFRAQVTTPQGPVAVYVAHLPSVRLKAEGGFTVDQRDVSAQALGDAIQAEPLKKVLLLGDLNGTMNDRSLAPVTSQMRSAQGAAGDGFGFSWPAAFPMARIDQIMSKGALLPVDSRTLPRDGSDHLAVAATYRYA